MIDETAAASLDALASELALVREVGLEALDLEPLVGEMPTLSSLALVEGRTHSRTGLAIAQAICAVVREAADRLSLDDGAAEPPGPLARPTVQAQLLFRTHYKTRAMSVAEARIRAREASGLEDRQYRRRQEPRLLRLVAQALVDLDRKDDLRRWGRALEVGSDVPQTIAMYWLYLFRDHYFRLETAAFALQFDYSTAVTQLKGGLPSWRDYLATAVYWNVEFSYLRQRFFRTHGPLWFAPTDEGCSKLNDAVERIEYHDPFPDEFMAQLRRMYGSLDDPDHDTFAGALATALPSPSPIDKAETWLRTCQCIPTAAHAEKCEIGLVLANCDVLGDTVEDEFSRIQDWYRNPRFSVQADLGERILDFRTPQHERPSVIGEA